MRSSSANVRMPDSPSGGAGSEAVAKKSVSRLVHLYRGREDVACAAHGLDHRRPLGIVLELAPKPPDLDIYRPVERSGLPVTREVEQPVAGQHLIGIIDEGREQIKLPRGEPNLLPRGGEQLAAGKIEVPAGESRLRTRRGYVIGPGRGASQDTLDPRQQLAQVERFWQVVIRAHFEADDAVDNLAASGQDDDPDARFLPQ